MAETKTKKKNWIADTFRWLFDIKDWKMLFRSIPSGVVALFAVSVVVMNLAAAKSIVLTEPAWLGVTGGVLISFLPFLISDILVRSYGSRAVIKLNIFGLILNLCSVGFLHLITLIQIGGDPNAYTAFNTTFSQTWQILLASSIAFIVSGIVNPLINVAVGKLFKKNPNSKTAYAVRSYVSTMIGQFVDNFIFTGLAFLVFFKLSIGTSLGWNIYTVIGAATFGALLELLMEVVFSPIGYRVSKKWQSEGVGADYLEYCKAMELKEDTTRFDYSNEAKEKVKEEIAE